jgi:hypothetical protein
MTDFAGLIRTLVDARVDFGDLDLLGELTGGGGFEQLEAHASKVRLFDREVRCLDLEWLIRVKRAAGRPRDLEAIAELEALREERDRGTSAQS